LRRRPGFTDRELRAAERGGRLRGLPADVAEHPRRQRDRLLEVRQRGADPRDAVLLPVEHLLLGEVEAPAGGRQRVERAAGRVLGLAELAAQVGVLEAFDEQQAAEQRDDGADRRRREPAAVTLEEPPGAPLERRTAGDRLAAQVAVDVLPELAGARVAVVGALLERPEDDAVEVAAQGAP